MIQPERSGMQKIFEMMLTPLIIGIILLASGVVTLDNPFAEQPAPIEEPIQENVSEVIIVNITTTIPTPEPTPTLSEGQWLSLNGGHKLGTWISFQRDNVSGLKDLSFHTRVWDYKELYVIKWWSYQWGQYFMESPGPGKKYLFVFVDTFTDEGSARMWLVDESNYYLDINGEIYTPTDTIDPAIRIKDFDNFVDGRFRDGTHAGNAVQYGYIRTQDELNRDTAIPIGFQKAGKSNMVWGYIPFVVNSSARIEDVKVIGRFDSLMPSQWWQLE